MPTCDVKHCAGDRPYNGRLCNRCDTRLPAILRVGIITAQAEHRFNDWRDACAEAAKYLNLRPAEPVAPIGAATLPRPPAPARPSVSPQRSYELQARMLGEALDP